MFGKKKKDRKTESHKKRIKLTRGKAIVCGFAGLAVLAAVFVITGKMKSGEKVEVSTTMSAEVETGDVSTSISASGTLTGEEIASINLPAGIKIKKVLVSQGDTVKKGSKLASVYPASVAEILLNVRESIDDTEDDIDDLDEDEIVDTSSDSYLEKLTLDQQLSELEELEDKLETILKSGYITADRSGVIGTVLVSDDTELGSQSTGTQSGTSTETVSDTDTSYVSDGSTDETSYSASTYSTAAAVPSRMASSNVHVVRAFLTASADDSNTNSLSSSGISENGDQAAEEGTTEEETDKTEEDKTTDKEQKDGEGDSSSGQSSSDDTSGESGSKDNAASSDKNSTTTGTGNNNNSSGSGNNSGTGQNGQSSQTQQGSQAGGRSGGQAGGSPSGSSGASSSTSTSTESSIGDLEMVSAFTLNSDEKMLVTVSVDEADIQTVQEGLSADITLTALPDETLSGEIVEVGSSASDSSGSVKYPVSIALDKTDSMLEGMSASAVIYIEQASDALLIPSAAIQEEKGKAYVYTKKESDGILSGKTEVTTGLSDGSRVQISQGLSEGDTVYYTIVSSTSDKSGSSEKGEDRGGMRDGMSGPPTGGPDGNFGGGSGHGPGGSGGKGD